MKAALLREVDEALVEIGRLDREGDHEGAHATEDRLVAAVLAAAIEGKTNWRAMARRTLVHLDQRDKFRTPRW